MPASSPAPSPSRPPVWLIALWAAALAAAGITYVLPQPAVWLANLGWTIASAVAVVGLAAVVRRSEPAARRGWQLLLWSCGAWLAGQIAWDVYSTVDIPPSPNFGDIGWMASAILATAGVQHLGRDGRRARSTTWLEVAPIVVAVFALMTALLWTHVTSSHLPLFGQVTALSYPVLYACAALVMVQSLVTGALDVRTNPGLRAVAAGLVVEAAAFIFWSPELLEGGYVVGTNAIDALWTLGMGMIGLGAWSAGPVRATPDGDETGADRGGLLPGVTFGALAVAQVFLILTAAPDPALLALSLGLMLVGVALMARGTVQRRAQASLYGRVRARELDLQVLNERLGEESRRDPLTGLGNRLRLSEDLLEIDGRAQRYEHGYCLVLCDLDRFKAYNDAMGHQAGDDVLRRVAGLLERNARAGDRLYRYGGEELLLLLPEQDEREGRVAAEHHRAALEHAAIAHPAHGPGVVTFSAGVAAAGLFESPEDVLRRADRALYDAKAKGRNRVHLADPLPL